MAVFRIEKNRGYTVMSNFHLRDKNLSLKAKGLLSQMLSLPEDWDYTLKGLSRINREGIDAIRTAVWELEKAGYITRQQKRDNKGKMGEMIYVIYERPQPKSETENEAQPGLDKPVLDFPTPGNPTSENPTQLNKDIQNKEKQITDSIPFPSLTPPLPEEKAAEPPEGKGNDITETYQVYEEVIKDNIGYDILRVDMPYDTDRLDEIVDLILETVCTSRRTIRIAGDDYPSELVKARFLKLNCEHIRFVLYCLNNNTTEVRNMKQYLRTTLFNAPSTMSNYYSAKAAHDMSHPNPRE